MRPVVFAELEKILGEDFCKAKEGEASGETAERLVAKANNMTDPQWESLSETTQRWVNSSLTALEKKQPVALPPGYPKEGEASEAAPAKGKAKAPPAAPKKAKAPAKPLAKAKGKPTPAKKAKAPPKKAAPAGAARGPKGRFGLTDVVKLKKGENPYRAGTKCHAWWGLYRDGMTVEAAIEAGVPRHHIRWDQTQEYVKIG